MLNKDDDEDEEDEEDDEEEDDEDDEDRLCIVTSSEEVSSSSNVCDDGVSASSSGYNDEGEEKEEEVSASQRRLRILHKLHQKAMQSNQFEQRKVREKCDQLLEKLEIERKLLDKDLIRRSALISAHVEGSSNDKFSEIT